MNIHEFDDIVIDADGNAFGQGFAFTVGSKFAGGCYIVNLMMTDADDVLSIVSADDDPEEILFSIIVPSYEEGVAEALGFLSLHPGWILDVSEKLLED